MQIHINQEGEIQFGKVTETLYEVNSFISYLNQQDESPENEASLNYWCDVRQYLEKDSLKVCLYQVESFNKRTNRTIWKVFPELCFVTVPNQSEPIFVEEVYLAAKHGGKKDSTQSGEEIGAVGQAYLIGQHELLLCIEAYLEHVENQVDNYFDQLC
jgi:hypothetical protein